MNSRRKFIQTSGLLTSAVFINPQAIFANAPDTFESKRPPVDKRKFTSKAVEKKILQVKNDIADPQLAWLFENCFPNTLDTTVDF
jgi:hypothetical protein